MPYVTSWERRGEEKGYDRGVREERIGGSHKMIEAVLEVRFGSAALALAEDIRKQTDLVALQKLIDASKTVASLDAFRALLQ